MLSTLVAFFKPNTLGKKKRGGAKSQRIKPGIQYQWDEESRRWIPVLKRPPSIVTYKPSIPVQSSTLGQSSTLDKSTQPKPSKSFSLRWPLDLGFFVTQDFQGHLKTKAEKGYKYYNGGLDLAYQDVREGAYVYAAASGVLKSASFSGEGYGYVVYIDHLNGYQTIYAHLSGFGGDARYYVSTGHATGHAVDAGDIIGQLGHSGNCWGGSSNPEGTHLHFELRYLGKPVDPMPYLS